jgi:hypothetical protein
MDRAAGRLSSDGPRGDARGWYNATVMCGLRGSTGHWAAR